MFTKIIFVSGNCECDLKKKITRNFDYFENRRDFFGLVKRFGFRDEKNYINIGRHIVAIAVVDTFGIAAR